MATVHSGSSSQITLTHITEAQKGNRTPLVLALRALLLEVLKRRMVPEAIAEELAQEHALRLAARFCQGVIREESWSCYTRRTAIRLAATYHRQASREEPLAEEPPASAGRSVEDLLLQGEIEERISRALATLSGPDRTLLEQIYFQEIPLCALLADSTRDALYKRHERAKARLRKALERLIGA
jgi:DNA-directed RNA polymerase specialized sigma24 family protein